MLPKNAPKITAGDAVTADDEKTHDAGSSRADSGTATRASFASPDVWYQCQRCGNCCRWPGFVRVSERDITAIAGFLGLAEADFIASHTRLRPQRDGLALIEKPNGECIFLEGVNHCTIQAVKPHQCGGFPNAWNFPGWREECEAVEISFTEGHEDHEERLSPACPS